MDLQVAELVLTYQKIAYFKTDARLNITEAGGSFELLQHLEIKNQPLHAINAKKPGQGAYFSSSSVDLFGALALGDVIPDILEHSNKLLNVLHGIDAESYIAGLRFAPKDSAIDSQFVNVRTVPQLDRAGRITGLIHLLEDISATHSLHHRLEYLTHSVEMLQNQLDMAAHELSTPLTLISGYLEILTEISERELTKEQEQCLELIESSVDNLHIVVKSLFDIVFAEADGLRLALQPVDISQIVEGAVLEFQHHLERRSQTIIVKSGRRHPHALCDHARIIQVMNNLLSNASKFSPVGSTIEIEITSDIDDNMIQVAITDNGSGIGRDEHKAIFERFYRTKFGKRAEAQGAGLGLYLCRTIIKMHSGDIWCQDSAGSGTTFCFTLPCTDLQAVAPASANHSDYEANVSIRTNGTGR